MQPSKCGVFWFVSCLDIFLGTGRGEQLVAAGLSFSVLCVQAYGSPFAFVLFFFPLIFFLEVLLVLKILSQIFSQILSQSAFHLAYRDEDTIIIKDVNRAS